MDMTILISDSLYHCHFMFVFDQPVDRACPSEISFLLST